jgi:hypothetical protein
VVVEGEALIHATFGVAVHEQLLEVATATMGEAAPLATESVRGDTL